MPPPNGAMAPEKASGAGRDPARGAGEVLGQLPPGQHTIDAQELPVIGVFIDKLFDGNAYRAELFFCRTTQVRGLTFGGRFADLREPDFGLLVEVRCYGDYAVRVND